MSKNNKFKYLLGSILFILLSASFIKSSFDVLKSKDRLDEIQKEVQVLEEKKMEIEKEIAYKRTDEFIEDKARNDLNLIKPGEKVYIVVGGNSSPNDVLSGSDVREEDEKKSSNWYSWYRLFFDN